MSNGYKISEQDELHYVTFQVVRWIDIFTRKVYRDIVVESLRYCQQNKGLEIYAFVVMSNHIHAILRSSSGRLSDTIREFKSFTAKQMLDVIQQESESRSEWMLSEFEFAAKKHKRNEKYQLWTHENHPIILYSKALIQQRINYIHDNPVRSGIVANQEDYLYSSARAYAGMDCMLDVIVPLMDIEKIPLMRTMK
jgi:REP element-mobilizing transposase RayT